MIYVNQKQLDQVEYLIEQSTRGHHILFDIDAIRYAFHQASVSAKKSEPLKSVRTTRRTTKAARSAPGKAITPEKHIENLILQPTLISKRAYLESLSRETYGRVVRTYFSIVENNIFESQKFSQ